MTRRRPGEITPVSVVHSHTFDDHEERYRAEHAIDLNWWTMSFTVPGSDGGIWLKLSLDKVHCIQTVRVTSILMFIVSYKLVCFFGY